MDIARFVEDYVDIAFAFASSEPTLFDFDEKTRKGVSERMKVPENVVLTLHHPIYWSLFNRNGESPLELIQPSGMQQCFVVKPTRADYDWRKPTVDYILKNYGELLEFKLKQVNTAPQSA